MTVVRSDAVVHPMATIGDEQNSGWGSDSLATLMGASDLFHRLMWLFTIVLCGDMAGGLA